MFLHCQISAVEISRSGDRDRGSLVYTIETVAQGYKRYVTSFYETALRVLRSSGTSNNLHQRSSDDGLTGSIVEDLVFVDHVSGVLRGVLAKQYKYTLRMWEGSTKLTSIALRRADCSQA